MLRCLNRVFCSAVEHFLYYLRMWWLRVRHRLRYAHPNHRLIHSILQPLLPGGSQQIFIVPSCAEDSSIVAENKVWLADISGTPKNSWPTRAFGQSDPAHYQSDFDYSTMKPKQERRLLGELYARIPTFDCIPGCHDCCGPVYGSREEIKKAPLLETWKGVSLEGCLSCPYVTSLGCGIYNDRPLICRIYGATEDPRLQCPHGRGPERKLSIAETNEIWRRYLKLEFRGGLAISGGMTELTEPAEWLGNSDAPATPYTRERISNSGANT
jgi:uncharacterized protein